MKKAKALLIFVFIVVLYNLAQANSAEVDWMPDPALRVVVCETIGLVNPASLTKEKMPLIRRLEGSDTGIKDLTGLEYATDMFHLSLCGNNLSGTDFIPIANLTQLGSLELCVNQIEDVSSFANLINLRTLDLGANKVSDITPLANLTELRELNLGSNPIESIEVLKNFTKLTQVKLDNTYVFDFTPLSDLNLIELIRDKVAYRMTMCIMSPAGLSVLERIQNRTYPSIAAPGSSLVTEANEGLELLTPWDHEQDYFNLVTKHDITFFSEPPVYGVDWAITPSQPTEGLATQLEGRLLVTDTGEPIHTDQYQRYNQPNPNFINLTNGNFNISHDLNFFPPDSDFWLRDAEGNILETGMPWGEYQIDFMNPEVQQLLIDRHVAIANYGLFQGIFFDNFNSNNTGGVGIENYQATDEEIIAATTRILQGIRERVRDDFLILVNANRSKLTRFTEIINGAYMETDRDGYIYTYKDLIEIEDALLWNERNLREPRINVLQSVGLNEPFRSPNNLRWMRLFTTLSLTHSDGYVLFKIPRKIGEYWHGTQIWYDFWDADLGRPIGEKAENYDNREGLFIREFTNGWAVYNRSGVAQTINFPIQTTGVANGQRSRVHIVPDLDGEIYLKSTADLNADGVVNILDLVIVANAFGQTEPDLNADGVVNILDLVIIANSISQRSK